MGLNEDRLKAMRFERPEAIPINVGALPAVWMKYREDYLDLVHRHPACFEGQPWLLPALERDLDDPIVPTFVEGTHVDAWGCVWTNVQRGMEAIVTGHPVATREAVRTLKAPEVNIGLPHGFMFLRLADLRGFEQIMLDFATEPPELQMLIDIVLEYNLRQVDYLLGLDPVPTLSPGILWLGDDLGMQHGLPISPEKWRKYLKPCYTRIFAPLRAAGYAIHMHTDGHILEIIPDLIECGVDVLNAQSRANGLDNLAAACKGKVCLNLDLDRQMFPFATPAELEAHVREVVEKLGSPEGGLWIEAQVSQDTTLKNIEAICVALEKYRHYTH